MQNKTYNVVENAILLDFLLANVNQGRNKIKTLLKNKCILVNGKPTTKFDFPLKKGDGVQISKAKIIKENPNIDIIFEDEQLLVINKKAGLLSIASDKESVETAYRYAMQYVKLKKPNQRIFIVHRLDKETSGVLMFAKTDEFKFALQDNWDTLVKKRQYTAIVEGVPEQNQGVVKSYLKQTKTHLVYSSDDKQNGKLAITNYKIVAQNENYAKLEILLETGRKNQIRVHMKDIGTPIAGDKKYGAKTNPQKRLLLHANKLELIHPQTNKLLTFTAPLPKGFNGLVQTKQI